MQRINNMKNPKKLYSHSFKAQQTLLDYLLLPESENISTKYDKGILPMCISPLSTKLSKLSRSGCADGGVQLLRPVPAHSPRHARGEAQTHQT